MMRVRGKFLVVGLVLLGCRSGGMQADDPSDETNHEEDMAAAEALGPMPGEKDPNKPDMDFLKEMAGRSARQASKCDVPSNAGPREPAMVDVEFLPAGHTGEIVVNPPHDGTPIGNCIKRAFQGVIATGFRGEPVVIKQEVRFGKDAGKASMHEGNEKVDE